MKAVNKQTGVVVEAFQWMPNSELPEWLGDRDAKEDVHLTTGEPILEFNRSNWERYYVLSGNWIIKHETSKVLMIATDEGFKHYYDPYKSQELPTRVQSVWDTASETESATSAATKDTNSETINGKVE